MAERGFHKGERPPTARVHEIPMVSNHDDPPDMLVVGPEVQLWRLDKVAKFLCLSEKQAWNWCRSFEAVFISVGNAWFVNWYSIQRALFLVTQLGLRWLWRTPHSTPPRPPTNKAYGERRRLRADLLADLVQLDPGHEMRSIFQIMMNPQTVAGIIKGLTEKEAAQLRKLRHTLKQESDRDKLHEG